MKRNAKVELADGPYITRLIDRCVPFKNGVSTKVLHVRWRTYTPHTHTHSFSLAPATKPTRRRIKSSPSDTHGRHYPLSSCDIFWTLCTRLHEPKSGSTGWHQLRENERASGSLALSEIKLGVPVKNARVSTSGKDLVYRDSNGRRDVPFAFSSHPRLARAKYRERDMAHVSPANSFLSVLFALAPPFFPPRRARTRHVSFFSRGRNQFFRDSVPTRISATATRRGRISRLFPAFGRIVRMANGRLTAGAFPILTLLIPLFDISRALFAHPTAGFSVFHLFHVNHEARRPRRRHCRRRLFPRYDLRICRTYIESRGRFVCTLRACSPRSLFSSFRFLCPFARNRTRFSAGKHL